MKNDYAKAERMAFIRGENTLVNGGAGILIVALLLCAFGAGLVINALFATHQRHTQAEACEHRGGILTYSPHRDDYTCDIGR